jgi:hypothetical protein
MMNAPFARFGGFAFALVATLIVSGVAIGPSHHESVQRSETARTDADAPRRQRRRGEATAFSLASPVVFESVLTRRGTRTRAVVPHGVAAAGPGPRMAATLTRRGTRLRPADDIGTIAALR